MSYKNKNGKTVSGAAETLHNIYTVHGGIEQYNESVGKAYIEEFLRQFGSIVNARILRKSK